MSFGISDKELLKDYKKDKADCAQMILQKVFKCCVPVNFIEQNIVVHKTEDGCKEYTTSKATPTTILNAHSTCPCGSGKSYFECHGRRLVK